MHSVKHHHQIQTLHVKNEVITIDEDVLQAIKTEDYRVQEEANIQNGGASKLIYYFEPQEKSNSVLKAEDKSELAIFAMKTMNS